jgi:hypothetical protein
MELEEMKSLWEEMTAEIEKQKKLTDQLILKMTHIHFRQKIYTILIPEAIGSLISVATIAFIFFRFEKLNTWYLQTAGIISALILAILPILSFRAIHKMLAVHISAQNYKVALSAWNKGRKRFVLVRKLGFYLGAILLALMLPVMVRLRDGKDVFLELRTWLSYAIALPFFFFFAKWVFRKYFKIATDAENILRELED